MKKTVIALGILLLSLGIARTAYAGSLNEYESELINAAQGTFKYNGMDYKLDKTYVNMALEYLMSDEVDLDQYDRDKLLSSMYDYVEAGVKDGYLVPIVTPTPIVTPKVEPPSDSDQTKDSETSEEDMVAPSVTGDPAKSEVSADSEIATTITASDKQDDNKGEFLGGLLSKASDPTEDNKTTDSTDSKTETNADTTIIKNTGFNLNVTITIATMLGVIMLIGIIVTVKHNFFAHRDE